MDRAADQVDSFPAEGPAWAHPSGRRFQGDAAPTDYFEWRANVASKGRALWMLFLFSDVGPKDAPTRIRVGSHIDIAKRLAFSGEAGQSLRFIESVNRPQVHATGEAGTVFLCHPFFVHAAQAHHGTNPRFMAQPALLPAEPFQIDPKRAGDAGLGNQPASLDVQVERVPPF